MSSSYSEFLADKMITAPPSGFEPRMNLMPSAIKPFQRDVAVWSCRRGRSAIFTATGLGKTLDELAFARQVVAHCCHDGCSASACYGFGVCLRMGRIGTWGCEEHREEARVLGEKNK